MLISRCRIIVFKIQDFQVNTQILSNVVQFTIHIHIYTEIMQIFGKDIEVHRNLVKPKL